MDNENEQEDADEEEPFFIKEDNDEEDQDFGAVAAVDPESTARPRYGWIFISHCKSFYKAEIWPQRRY